jgi:di/tricarboxylate transporter
VHGHARDVERARRQGELLVLSERQLSPSGPGGWLVGATLAAALIAAALGWPLAVCALAGALTLVLLRCVDPGEALEAIDWSVILLTGGLLALGRAFVDHGLGTTTASAILSLEFLGDSHHALLGAVILCTSLLTQLTTNVSAVVVMAPVALSLAQQAGADPRPFLVAVALSASFAFLSPVGHAANTMVAGPGDYRFVHFLRVGAPLLALEAGLLLALVPVLWPF